MLSLNSFLLFKLGENELRECGIQRECTTVHGMLWVMLLSTGQPYDFRQFMTGEKESKSWSREEGNAFFPATSCTTINLGTGLTTADDFRIAFTAAGCWITEHANDILNSPAFRVAEATTKITLAIRSVADLGFDSFPTYQELCARARELGLELCPAEVGPQLRLQHLSQPALQWLKIAMEPIIHASGHPVIFPVDRSISGGYLGTRYADSLWCKLDQFVFLAS